MHFSTAVTGREDAILDLFKASFTASEGPEEGALIAGLVRNLLSNTPKPDRRVVTAEARGRVVGGCVFSRLIYANDKRTVFVLAPVAVASDLQRQGIGQQLLTHGLAIMREAGVDIVMTYGDPAYYAKVGFQPIREADAPAPFPLTQPEGWQGQSLTAQTLTPLQGPSRCVPALNQAVFW
ncbi:putative acetyltransferase [Thiorhodovibrio winogradskyi]|uniref:Acetyltransferase n=1 Tax=Thiorhodovibrio winogradskyi TaxID=77007 RepID=A0ABZ0SBX4_9GAMM|nr:N-acetyltransferase [Thiorhodovibrio winogradskyi]